MAVGRAEGSTEQTLNRYPSAVERWQQPGSWVSTGVEVQRQGRQ